MQTVQSIPGAIPILHSGPGCASKLNDNNGTSGRFSANIYPCTSISEKEVVFGGSDKLRSTIKNALRVIDADLFVCFRAARAKSLVTTFKPLPKISRTKKSRSSGQKLRGSKATTTSAMTGF